VKILKVSVRNSGELLVDGRPASVAGLEEMIEKHKADKLSVWYHRENSADEPALLAMEVLKVITEHRVPVRLCAQPDFSDGVTNVEHAVEGIFASIREKAAHGRLVIMRPDGRQVALPALQNLSPEMLAGIEKILPSTVKRNVAVMGETGWTMGDEVTVPAANKAIPFFGLLMGLSCLGHAVWIFNPKGPILLTAGCRDADVLILDDVCCSILPLGWQAIALSTMRNKEILVHDRETNQLRKA
jgi:hypothetical protein